MLRVRAYCGCRLFTAKLAVVAHNLAHQLFDHLLSDEPILLACHFCDCLRDSVDDFICFSPAGETVARSTWRTRCRAILFQRVVPAADTFTSVLRTDAPVTIRLLIPTPAQCNAKSHARTFIAAEHPSQLK